MSQNPCNCPPFEGKDFYGLIEAFGLLKRKGKSKNCCEQAGYLCPNLDVALKKAYAKQYSQNRSAPAKEKRPTPTKTLTKKRLSL